MEKTSQQNLFFSIIYLLASSNVKYYSDVKNFMSDSVGVLLSYIATSGSCICKNLEVKRRLNHSRCFHCVSKVALVGSRYNFHQVSLCYGNPARVWGCDGRAFLKASPCNLFSHSSAALMADGNLRGFSCLLSRCASYCWWIGQDLFSKMTLLWYSNLSCDIYMPKS